MFLPPSHELYQLFLFHATAGLGVLTSMGAAVLFWVTYRYERKMRTAWRAAGFFALAIAFSLSILGSFRPAVAIAAAAIEALAFFLLWRGVAAELTLTPLRKVATYEERMTNWALGFWSLNGHWVFGIGAYTLSIVFIALTLRLQIKRYRQEDGHPEIHRQNLYPLFAYIFLLLYSAFQAVSLFTTSSAAWHLSLLYAVIGFIFLAAWEWIFIRVRSALRVSLLFLTTASVISSVIVLFLTFMVIFGIQALISGAT